MVRPCGNTHCNYAPKTQLLVCSIQSLWRTEENRIPYDIVIFDEMCSILEDGATETTKRTRECFEQVEWAVKNARTVIMFDAHIHDTERIWADMLIGEEHVAVLENKASMRPRKNIYTVPMPVVNKKLADIQEDEKNDTDLEKQNEMLTRLKDCWAKGKKTAMVCNTKVLGNWINQNLLKLDIRHAAKNSLLADVCGVLESFLYADEEDLVKTKIKWDQ